MRITDRQIFHHQVQRLGRLRTQQVETQETIASGKRVNRPSDDPAAWARLTRLDSREQGLDSLQLRAQGVQTRLSAAEGSLYQVTNLLQRARELTIQGLNGSYSATERANFSAELEGLREHMLQLANSELDGQYLFAGTNVTTEPFGVDGEYQGGGAGVLVQVGEGLKVDVALDGGEVFQGEVDLPALFDRLIENFQNNDVDALDGALDEIRDAEDQVLRGVTEIGARIGRVSLAQELSDELELAFAQERQVVGDADIASAISKLSSLEYSLQAAVQVSQGPLEASLLNIL